MRVLFIEPPRFGQAFQEYKRKKLFLIPRPKPLILGLVRLTQKQRSKSGSFSSGPITFTITSLLGLGLLATLLFYPTTAMVTVAYQNQLIGSLFTVICVMGAMAGNTPSRCSQMLHFKKPRNVNPHRVQETNPKEATISIKGHHPACGSFSAHIFQIGDKTYCAGCTALVTGAALALMGTALYFFVGLSIGGFGPFLFWLGFVGVACGLLQYLWFASKASIHFFLDAFFVIGAFFLLVGVDNMNGSLALELYLLVMILYWIMTRITLSKWEHKKKCANCSAGPCGFVE
jgi:hypothetical protein